jgi:hypothetical protein
MTKQKRAQFITVVFEAANGFTKRTKWQASELTPIIKIPFMYRIRVSDPVIGDRIGLEVTPVGEFRIVKRTKTTALYKLVNLYQASTK